MLEFVPDLPPSPEQELNILYQFCGAGDVPGGVASAVNASAAYMKSQGHDVSVFVGTSDDIVETRKQFSKFDPKHGIKVLAGKNHQTTANGSQNQLGGRVRKDEVRSAIAQVDPDIIDIQGPWIPWIGGKVLEAANERDIPTVARWHIHSEEFKTNAALKATRFVNWRQIHALDALIAVSPVAEEHMRATYDYKGPVHIIPNAIDVATLSAAQPFAPDEVFPGFDPINNKIISFVGRPDDRKGLGELLHAVKQLRKDTPDIQLLVAGKGPELEKYIHLSRTLGIAGITKFLGYVSEINKARLFASSDIAALPALRNETQGIVILEAIAAGAKVAVVGENPGYGYTIGSMDSPEMVTVDPTNPYEFAGKMSLILNSESLSYRLHKEQQPIVKHFDIQVIGRRIESVYRQHAA